MERIGREEKDTKF